MKIHPLLGIALFIVSLLTLNYYFRTHTPKDIGFAPPTQSPYHHNVGVCFNVEQATWFIDPSIKYNLDLQDKYTYERLKVVTQNFKLIRIYAYLISGWEQVGNITPEAYSLLTSVKADTSIEAVIGTSNNKAWYLQPANVQTYIDTLQSQFGTSISQVKTLLIGNEINANGYSQSDIATLMTNYKTALKLNKLNIPVTVTFSNLPIQRGDSYSDSLVAAVVENWDSTWNNNIPFVFINPYPDAAGINNAAGVYTWQKAVTKYYQNKYPTLQIFIGETGAEGSSSDSSSVVIENSVFAQLDSQYVKIQKTVPTFMFEGLNEGLKPAQPNQQFMGIYHDTTSPKLYNKVYLKNGVVLPTFMK